ncbi:hypothetical protein PUN28_011483 [Cardiocondyla obscurior]|uniref:Uncharacterized protein n=1 Tax=Cardiocondyla obscurior TaxID=286306 RepID=A0AAW2FJ39_9HYME
MLENFLREYNNNRILLLTTGLWPYQNKLVRSLLWTFCFLLELSYYPFEILLLYDHSDDAQLIFEGCYQILILTIFLVRHLKDCLNRGKMRWIYEAIDRHWSIFTDDIEVRIMEEYSILSRKLVTYYTSKYIFTLKIVCNFLLRRENKIQQNFSRIFFLYIRLNKSNSGFNFFIN